MKREKKDLDHIGNILDRVMEKCGREVDAGMIQVWKMWDNILEKEIIENAQPAAFKGDLLLVHVTSSVWMQQLQFIKSDIIKKINDVAGKKLVGDIKFKIGI